MSDAAPPSPSPASSTPLGFGDVSATPGDHIAHFFREADERFSVLGPYVETGLQRGDRCVFIADPDTGTALCDWLAARGVDVDEARAANRLLIHPGRDTEADMKHLADEVSTHTPEDEELLVRWAGDGEWALDRDLTVCEMLRWEALYDEHSADWEMLALCQFNLSVFDSDVMMEALRTHPYCVMGEVVVPNPFHESPETVLQDLEEGL